MDVKTAVRAAIERYGREFSLERDGEVLRFTACVLPRALEPAGENEEARIGQAGAQSCTYYAPAEGAGGSAEEGDVLVSADGERFELGTCQDFYFGGTRLLRRAPAWKVREGFLNGPF